MSAFIHGKDHINGIIASALHCRYGKFSWYHNSERHELTDLNANEVGQMLLDENVKSVNYRYEGSPLTDLPGRIDAEWVVPFVFHFVTHIPKAMETIKMVNSLAYQSCEHTEWESSNAKAFCDALIHVKIGELPGYDDAKGWEWEDADYYAADRPIRLV